MASPELSIVILNYNTKKLVINCINSIVKNTKNLSYEIIVVDNASTDGSQEAIKSLTPKINLKLLLNKKNLGFSKGNNKAKGVTRGKYILFLNSDTLVQTNAVTNTLGYLKSNKNIGAITCKLVLKNGEIDKDTIRSFPTPWIALTHFLYLDRFFPTSKLFAKYWYGYLPKNKIQEIEAIQGAFFLTSKKVLDKSGWFDEDYFLNGEDIDLSWKIKKLGYKNIYYPEEKITHLKGATKGKKISGTKTNISLKEKIKFSTSGIKAMEIFYKKRLSKQYPIFMNYLVYIGIFFLKIIRLAKVIIS